MLKQSFKVFLKFCPTLKREKAALMIDKYTATN